MMNNNNNNNMSANNYYATFGDSVGSSHLGWEDPIFERPQAHFALEGDEWIMQDGHGIKPLLTLSDADLEIMRLYGPPMQRNG